MAGQCLSVGKVGGPDWRVENEFGPHAAQGRKVPGMGKQLRVPHPGQRRQGPTGDRQTVDAGIGKGDGLNGKAGDAISNAEQGGLERQHPDPIAIGAFRKQDQPVALCQPGGDAVALVSSLQAALTLDIDGLAKIGEAPDQPPLAHVRLGDEGRTGNPAAKQRNISPAEMIGDEQQRPVRRWPAMADDLQTERAAETGMEQARQGGGPLAAEAAPEQLRREQQRGGGNGTGERLCRAEWLADQAFFSSGTP